VTMIGARSDSALLTADDLERVDLPQKSTELLRGHLVVREPPGVYHGMIAARLAYLAGAFVYPRGLGVLFGQDTGFKIASDPDTVLAPDFAFVRADRARNIPRRGYAEVVPDLVAEIMSPGDGPGEILSKVGSWLSAGVKLVWVIDPERGEARVHRADGSLSAVPSDGALDGDDILPGFSCSLSAILTMDP